MRSTDGSQPGAPSKPSAMATQPPGTATRRPRLGSRCRRTPRLYRHIRRNARRVFHHLTHRRSRSESPLRRNREGGTVRVYPVARGRKRCDDTAVAIVAPSVYALARGSTRRQVADTLLGYLPRMPNGRCHGAVGCDSRLELVCELKSLMCVTKCSHLGHRCKRCAGARVSPRPPSLFWIRPVTLFPLFKL